MMRYFIFLVAMMGIVSAAMAQQAPTQEQAQSKNPLALPEIQSMPMETYAAQSEEVKKEFREDPYLAFNVQLPKNLTEQAFDTLKNRMEEDRLYGEVFRKYGEAVQDVRPYFSVQTYKPDRLISAKNWFVTRLLENGQTLKGLSSDKKGDSFEGFYIRIDHLNNTEIVRAKGYLKGPRIVLAEYVVPILLWDRDRDIQAYAIKSFELKGMADNTLPEPLMSYSFLESFSMQYPQSWRLDADQKTAENRIDLSFFTADDMRVVYGNIDLTLVADQSLKDPIDRSRYPTNIPQIIKERRQQIIDKGYLIDDVMERRQYDLAIDSKLQVTEVYPLRKKLTDYVTHRKAPVTRELWITVIKGTEETGKNYIVSMVLPSRIGASSYKWATGAKAYETILESIR